MPEPEIVCDIDHLCIARSGQQIGPQQMRTSGVQIELGRDAEIFIERVFQRSVADTDGLADLRDRQRFPIRDLQLARQTIDPAQYEVILVDNNSKPPMNVS